MKKGEMINMNQTMEDVMEYLTKTRPMSLGGPIREDEGKFVSYAEISKVIGKSRHAVAYAVEKLCRLRKLWMSDRKLYIVS